jgi:hypothetical protein
MRFIGRGVLPYLAAVLFVLAFAGSAAANLEQDLPEGRLGYRWVPDPPAQPRTETEEMALQIAKYGGGGLLGIWLLRKMFTTD